MGGVKMEVEVEVLGADLKRQLDQLAGGMKNLRPALLSVGEYMLGQTEERFRNQKAPNGKSWKPVASSYWRQKKVKKILTESSRLRRSIHYRASDDEVVIGTNVRYARIHQLGGEIAFPALFRTAKRGTKGKNKGRFMSGATKAKHAVDSSFTIPAHTIKIPPRPFLGLSNDDEKAVREIIKEYVQRALKG